MLSKLCPKCTNSFAAYCDALKGLKNTIYVRYLDIPEVDELSSESYAPCPQRLIITRTTYGQISSEGLYQPDRCSTSSRFSGLGAPAHPFGPYVGINGRKVKKNNRTIEMGRSCQDLASETWLHDSYYVR